MASVSAPATRAFELLSEKERAVLLGVIELRDAIESGELPDYLQIGRLAGAITVEAGRAAYGTVEWSQGRPNWAPRTESATRTLLLRDTPAEAVRALLVEWGLATRTTDGEG